MQLPTFGEVCLAALFVENREVPWRFTFPESSAIRMWSVDSFPESLQSETHGNPPGSGDDSSLDWLSANLVCLCRLRPFLGGHRHYRSPLVSACRRRAGNRPMPVFQGG